MCLRNKRFQKILTQFKKYENKANPAQVEAYDAQKHMNPIACITLPSDMDNAIMCEFKKYDLVRDIWSLLKKRYDRRFIIDLIALIIKLDTYKKYSDHDIKKRLKFMSKMVNELRDASHILIEKQ